MAEGRDIDQFGKLWNTTRSLSLRLMDQRGDTTDSRTLDELPGDIGPAALVVAPDGGSLLLHLPCPYGEYVGVLWAVFAVRENGTLHEVARVSRWPTSERTVLRIVDARFLHREAGAAELRGRVTYSGEARSLEAEERSESFTVRPAMGARVTDYSVRTRIVEKSTRVTVIKNRAEFEQLQGRPRPTDDPDRE